MLFFGHENPNCGLSCPHKNAKIRFTAPLAMEKVRLCTCSGTVTLGPSGVKVSKIDEGPCRNDKKSQC